MIGGADGTLTQAFGQLAQPPWSDYLVKDEEFGLYGASIPVPNEEPGNSWELLSVRNQIFAVITKCDYHRMRHERVPGESFLELHFSLDGKTTLNPAATDEIAVRQSAMMLCRQAPGTNYTVYCPPGARALLSIYVHPSFLIRGLGITPDLLPTAARILLAEAPGKLVSQQFPLHFEIRQRIVEILDTPYVGTRRLHFCAAKLVELLCQCVQALETMQSDGEHAFTERDLRMFNRAREILSTQFNPQPTISSLARAVGTNTNKLKTGFKLIYGTTIFGFGHHHRMMHAMQLLQSRQHSVAQVANAVGYRSQASFSTAFKEFFSQLPRDARRGGQGEADTGV